MIFSPKYRKGTLFAMVITLLCQFTSVNVWLMYSNRVFTTINADIKESERVPANFVSQIIGYITFIGAVGAFWTVKRYPRRKLYLISGFLLTLLLLA